MLQYLPKDFVWIFSKRYIAGKELKNAVKVTKKLNSQGDKGHHGSAGRVSDPC